MNYISQLNGFWNWVRTNEISHLEVDLYLSILDTANTASWKTYFTIPNSTLGRFDKNSLTRARNKLVQYGLIEYQKGKKGQAPIYKIVRLYEDIIPNNDTYIDTDMDTNSDTNMQPIQRTYININKTKLYTPYNPPKNETQIDYTKIVELYNSVCVSLPTVKHISEKRKKAISARLKKYTILDLENAFHKCEDSSFLKGSNNRNWVADFDWIMKDANMAKVLDGKYDDKSNSSGPYEVYSESYNHNELMSMTREG